MALFRRKKVSSAEMPKEIDEYYKAERRQHVGVAWLLAIVTVVLTLILVAVLYFGGRWVYRTVFNKSSDGSSSTSQNDTNKTASNDDKTVKTNDEPNGSTTTPSPNPTTGQGTTTPTTAPSPTPTTSSSNNSAQSTAPTTTPNTGPGDMLAVFVVTVVIATIGHNLVLHRR